MINGQIVASVSTMVLKDGGALRVVEPDKDGVYRDVPLMVLGCASRNRACYETSSVIEAINDPNSVFHIGISEGNLEGEWAHPCIGANDESKMATLHRITHIDRTRVSHYIMGCRIVTTEQGNTIVYGDVVPFGPFGPYLTESFADPKRNTAFSVRSLTKNLGNQNGTLLKRIMVLKTFDAVDSPGFEKASKRFMDAPAQEGMDYILDEHGVEIDLEDLLQGSTLSELFSMESINDQQILDLFKTDQVVVMRQPVGVFIPETGLLLQDNNRHVTPFHAMFGRTANVDAE